MCRPPWLWLAFAGLARSTCGPPPISIPISDITLSNENIRRGVQAAVGTPPQNISFMVNAYFNNTWIFNATDSACSSNDTTSKCVTLRGGLYDTDNSSSYAQQANVFAAGADAQDTVRTPLTNVWSSAWATDLLQVGNVSLTNYPIGMPGFDVSGPFNTQAFMGLGRNSTFLQHLKDHGHIASRSWSYWWGVDNSESRSAMDGQLILDGYDAAKVVGTPFTQPLQPPTSACPTGMTVSFTDIILNFPNGTSSSDINPRNILAACIQPDFPAVMTIPAEPYFWRFQDITQTRFTNRTLGTYWYTPTYPPSDVFTGSLTLQVLGGPSVTIPNDVLVVPDEWTDQSGSTQYDSSTAVLLFSPIDGPNANDPMILGMNFFSGAYLTVNADNGTWSLWQAKATDNTKLVSITDEDGEKCEETFVAGSSGGEQRIEDGDNQQSQSAAGLAIGAIAGIAVGGGVALLLLLAIVIRCVVKKRRARRQATATDVSDLAPYESNYDWRHEADSTMLVQRQIQEMSGSQTGPYELGRGEKPVELPHEQYRYWVSSEQAYHKRQAVELPASRF